jgi:SAM-dependent methyltransferase
MSQSWSEFWARPNKIYVNDRHLAAHCRTVADALLTAIRDARDLRVMDFGCGDALDAARVAAQCTKLYLFDASPVVRERLSTRFVDAPGITVLDETALEDMPDEQIDLIFLSSVLQYVDPGAASGFLARQARRLAPGGRLVVVDIIPPGVGVAHDTASLLSFAAREGFFFAAFAGLVEVFFSGYLRLRRNAKLAIYDEGAILAKLSAAGLVAKRLPRNLGEHRWRRSYEACKPGGA